MADEFLTSSAEPVATAPKRKRGPMSEAQKAKIRASNQATRERKATEKPPQVPSVKTGISADEAEEMRLELILKATEAKVKEAEISEDNKLMVHRSVRADAFNVHRYYVVLTPSMCRSKDCPFDAAVEAGATSWDNAPTAQLMADGKTFGDRLIALRDYHEATAHTVQQMNDHIITASELAKRQWGTGQSIKNEFLTGAK